MSYIVVHHISMDDDIYAAFRKVFPTKKIDVCHVVHVLTPGHAGCDDRGREAAVASVVVHV